MTPLAGALLLLALQLSVPEKPVVVFTRPADCAGCDRFEQAVKHPAMQRRLEAVDFRIVSGDAASLAVQDPGGREVMRWDVTPTWLLLSDVLVATEAAAPHLLGSYSARDAAAVAEREWALAVLAFGDKRRGRELLESMRKSQSAENRELAAVWLERLGTMNPDTLTALAKSGSTDRVKFEAFMALGDARMNAGRYEAAVEAFDLAVNYVGGSSFARRNALSARQNAADLISPVVGLGNPGGIVTGRKTLTPRNLTKGAARVEFRLDGKTVATARRAPFAARVEFSRIPARQVLEVIALDRRGTVLSRSSVVVNERAEAFDVDFISPRSHGVSGVVDVNLQARVPRGRSVDEVLVEWNGRQVARFTAPPYRTRVEVGNEQGILRAVLRLDDGSETEDVLLANSGEALETRAHLVEVPAYFDRPADLGDVTVREDGKVRRVERVIPPSDAPLLIALVLDSSESMIPHMLDVQEAAVRFVEENVEPRDRTMVVGFTSNVRVLLRPSTDRALVERSILALRPKGGTALYDALVKTLLQMQSPESRKAVVVFSDGIDGSSELEADDVAEVARRAGVPVYVLSFGDEDQRMAEVSQRSGGKWFAMKSLEQLSANWSEIGADLRRQSLVIYRTEPSGAEWRTLNISANGEAVRAPAGVYVTSDR